MKGLLSICDNEGIDLQYEDLTQSGNVLGWYIPADDDKPPTIILDNSLIGRLPLKRTVLGEEVGHHFTVPQGSLAGPYFATVGRSLDRIKVSQDEARAIRWATDYLIPDEELAAAVLAGRTEPHELAEYFCVTEWAIWRKIHILRLKVWDKHKLHVRTKDIFSPLLISTLWGQKFDPFFDPN